MNCKVNENQEEKKRKSLIIVADDFGYGFNKNKGIVECYLNKSISCISFLVNCKHTESGAKLIKDHEIISGLHFNLTEGFPVSKPDKIPSLVSKEGKFLGKQGFWENKNIVAEHVKIELKCQLEKFQKLVGNLPSRVDGHQHVHIHPNVSKVFAEILAENKIKFTRLPLEYKGCKANHCETRMKFHNLIDDLASKSKKIFTSAGISICDCFIGMNFMGQLMDATSLQLILKDIFSKFTTCEFMVHPGYICDQYTDGFTDEKLADEFSMLTDREHEMKVLNSESMKKFYANENIHLKYTFL